MILWLPLPCIIMPRNVLCCCALDHYIVLGTYPPPLHPPAAAPHPLTQPRAGTTLTGRSACNKDCPSGGRCVGCKAWTSLWRSMYCICRQPKREIIDCASNGYILTHIYTYIDFCKRTSHRGKETSRNATHKAIIRGAAKLIRRSPS